MIAVSLLKLILKRKPNKGVDMQAVKVKVEDVANIINNMNNEELETLLLLMERKDRELLKRKQDIETGEVETLSRDEVFNV